MDLPCVIFFTINSDINIEMSVILFNCHIMLLAAFIIFLALEICFHVLTWMWQVSLWDGIIQSKEHAKFWIHTTNKYRFTDQARYLMPLFSSVAT